MAPLAPPKLTPRTATLSVIARANSWLSRSVTSGARRVPPALVGHSKSNATYASTVFSRSVFMLSTKVGMMPEAFAGRAQGALLLPTTVVGSYPQPDWLFAPAMLSSPLPPRTPPLEICPVAPQHPLPPPPHPPALPTLHPPRAHSATTTT